MQAAPALTMREYVCDTGMGPALRFAGQTDAKRRSKAVLLQRVSKRVFLFLLSTVVHFVACLYTHAHVCRLKICARARAALSVSRMLCWRLRPRTESSGQQICPRMSPICACENACAWVVQSSYVHAQIQCEGSAKLVREAHGDNSDFNTFNPYSEPLDAPEWGHSRQPGVKLATTSVPASRQDAGGSQLGGDATGVEQPAKAHGGNEQDEL